MGSCLSDLCILRTKCIVVSGLLSPCGPVSHTCLVMLSYTVHSATGKKSNSSKYHIVLSDHVLISSARKGRLQVKEKQKKLRAGL